MKEFIAGVAILMILLIFPLQSQVDTINAFKINRLDEIVFNAAERARFDGRFTDDNIKDIKLKVAQVFGVDQNEVIFNGTTTQKYRTENREDGRIDYEIKVKFGTVIPSAEFLGIDQDVNGQYIIKSGHVYSEVLYTE